MKAGRRDLKFQSLGEVMPEVDRLLEKGHATVGEWSLGQVCKHLADAIQGSIEGSDTKAPWLVRKIVAPIVLRRLLRSGVMPEGVKIPKHYLPKQGLDARAEAEALRAAIAYYQGHNEPLAAHPFFGTMNRADWTALHEVHCSHHLSFVIPS